MEDQNLILWKKIAEAMQAKGMDMPALAEKANLTRQTLYNVKKSGTGNLETIRTIANALEVGLSYLVA